MAQQQYYKDEGFKTQFEAAIPVLVIILLVVGVIALNPGIVKGVPILGDLFKSPTIDVLIIGESAAEANDWKAHLTGELAKKVFGNPVNVEVITDNQYNLVSSADWIDSKGYDIVILTATDLTSALQITMKDWAQSGGKLLVVGTGGTSDTGRWAELGTILPVKCGPTGDCSGVVSQVFSPTLYVESGMFENGLAKNVNKETPLTEAEGSINIAEVTVTGKQILYLGGFATGEEVAAGQTGNVFPGISEAGDVTGGKVVYVSFNPTTENITPAVEESVVINVLAYISGEAGYQST